jgi:hypothetical protein
MSIDDTWIAVPLTGAIPTYGTYARVFLYRDRDKPYGATYLGK